MSILISSIKLFWTSKVDHKFITCNHRSGWVPRGDSIASPGDQCTAELSYAVTVSRCSIVLQLVLVTRGIWSEQVALYKVANLILATHRQLDNHLTTTYPPLTDYLLTTYQPLVNHIPTRSLDLTMLPNLMYCNCRSLWYLTVQL